MMRWQLFFKYLAFFLLIPIASWMISLSSARLNPCNINTEGKFALSGLSEHVQISC